MTSWIIGRDQQKKRKLKVGGLVFVFKGAVSGDFFFCFFRVSSSPKSLIIALGSFRIFSKIYGDFACQGAPPVSTTQVSNLPPIPLIRWYRWQICHGCHWDQKQICRLCQWHRWQFATGINSTGGELISLTPVANNENTIRLHFKVNLKKKIYLYVDLTTQRYSN